MQLNDKLASLERRLNSLDGMQIFFLGGVVKSGTTWVERLLDSHPEVVCKGEAHFGSLLEPSLREAVAAYNSVIPKKGNWSRHKREGKSRVPMSDYLYLANDFNVLYAQTIRLMLVKWLEGLSIKCVGEKTPGNSSYFQRFRKLFPGAKFIYVVRDIRDVAVSGWFFNLAIAADETLSHFGDINEYGIHMGRAWANDVAQGLRFVDENNQQAMVLKYEDLWKNPVDETGRLFGFLGVDSRVSQIETSLAYTDFSRLSGGRTRGTENRSSFYRKGVIGDWRNHLEKETLVEIQKYAGGLMKQLGYI